jgi:hypothetical protein
MNDGADIFWNLHMVAILQPFHMHPYVCVCKILGALCVVCLSTVYPLLCLLRLYSICTEDIQ